MNIGADRMLPFCATMFHAVGLKAMDNREMYRDVWDVSTIALKTSIAFTAGPA